MDMMLADKLEKWNGIQETQGSNLEKWTKGVEGRSLVLSKVSMGDKGRSIQDFSEKGSFLQQAFVESCLQGRFFLGVH